MQKSDKRSINKQKKLITLYKAALKTFARYGFKKTTVEDIAGELGMTKGNIYLYVENKQDLHEKTIKYAVSEFLEVMRGSIRKEDDIIRQITRLAETGVKYMSENSDLRALLVDAPNIITEPSTFGERFSEIMENGVDIIKSILERGVQEKFFRNFDVDYVAELLFHFYGLFILNAFVLTDIISEGKSTAKMYTEIVNLVLFGIVKKNGDQLPQFPGFEDQHLNTP